MINRKAAGIPVCNTQSVNFVHNAFQLIAKNIIIPPYYFIKTKYLLLNHQTNIQFRMPTLNMGQKKSLVFSFYFGFILIDFVKVPSEEYKGSESENLMMINTMLSTVVSGLNIWRSIDKLAPELEERQQKAIDKIFL